MAVVTAQHHSAQRCCSIAHSDGRFACFVPCSYHCISDGGIHGSSNRFSSSSVRIRGACTGRHRCSACSCGWLRWRLHLLSPMTAPAPVVGYDFVAPAPSVTFAAPAPVIGYVATAPSVTSSAPAPVFEYVTPVPVFGFIAPAPAGSFVAPSQQLRPAYADDAAVVVSCVTGRWFTSSQVKCLLRPCFTKFIMYRLLEVEFLRAWSKSLLSSRGGHHFSSM